MMPGTGKRIGLTAGIGCGKSLVVQFLKELGVPTLDVDQVVHQLYQGDPELHQQIRSMFGPEVFRPDGTIDRKAIGRIVFQTPALRKQLESLIHPKVRQQMNQFFETHAQAPLAVAEIPLLFESKMVPLFDEVWVVKATAEQQVERLMAYKGYSREEAMARIQSQLPLNEKLQQTDVVIDNTGTPAQTQAQVQALIRERDAFKKPH